MKKHNAYFKKLIQRQNHLKETLLGFFLIFASNNEIRTTGIIASAIFLFFYFRRKAYTADFWREIALKSAAKPKTDINGHLQSARWFIKAYRKYKFSVEPHYKFKTALECGSKIIEIAGVKNNLLGTEIDTFRQLLKETTDIHNDAIAEATRLDHDLLNELKDLKGKLAVISV